MYCTVVDIRGDYAYVKYDDTGVISEVAIALLPFGIDGALVLLLFYHRIGQGTVLQCKRFI